MSAFYFHDSRSDPAECVVCNDGTLAWWKHTTGKTKKDRRSKLVCDKHRFQLQHRKVPSVPRKRPAVA